MRNVLKCLSVCAMACMILLPLACGKNVSAPSGPSGVEDQAFRRKTNTPTRTKTPVPQVVTATKTPTPVNTPCSTVVRFGDSTVGTGAVTLMSGTICQKYTLSGPTTLSSLVIDLAMASTSVKVGVYSDAGGYPSALLSASAVTSVPYGITAVAIPGVALSAGNYWLALSGASPLLAVPAAGSTAPKVFASGSVMPSTFPAGQSVSTTGQVVMFSYLNCP